MLPAFVPRRSGERKPCSSVLRPEIFDQLLLSDDSENQSEGKVQLNTGHTRRRTIFKSKYLDGRIDLHKQQLPQAFANGFYQMLLT